ncbi:hypothetical protein PSY81_23650, partial [Shigella flexneri]|nr:hypothetical protein [Shigella flexneri]
EEIDDDEDDELFMYEEDEFHDFAYSQAGSCGVVIEELPDSPRRKPGVVITQLPDSPRKDVPSMTAKKASGIVIRELDAIPTPLS